MQALLGSGGGPAFWAGRLWRAYETALERRPIATQAVTSSVLWGAGDLLAQRFAGSSDKGGAGVDVRRTALTALFGAAIISPCGHVWYGNLDKFAALFGPEGSARFLLAKLAADGTVWNAFYLAAFLAWGELVIDRGTVNGLNKQMQEEFVPTLLAEMAAWPPVMAAIFTRLPTSHHLLAVNVITLLDVAFLAIIRSGGLTLSNPWGQDSDSDDDTGATLMPTPTPTAAPSQQQNQMMLMPALASMHSAGGGGGSSGVLAKLSASLQHARAAAVAAAASLGSQGSGEAEAFEAAGAHAAVSSSTQILDAWVAPQHKPKQRKQQTGPSNAGSQVH